MKEWKKKFCKLCEGRKKIILDFDILNKLLKEKKTQVEICKHFNITDPTLSHYIKQKTGLNFIKYRVKLCGGIARGKKYPWPNKYKGIKRSREFGDNIRRCCKEKRDKHLPIIKELLNEGMVKTQICKKLNINHFTLTKIIKEANLIAQAKKNLNKYHINSGLLRQNYSNRFNNRLGRIYLVKFWNKKEKFIKVGITVNSVKFRFKDVNTYKFRSLFEAENIIFNCLVLEQKNKNKFKHYYYLPEKINNGFRSECFRLEAIPEIITYLQESTKTW